MKNFICQNVMSNMITFIASMVDMVHFTDWKQDCMGYKQSNNNNKN